MYVHICARRDNTYWNTLIYLYVYTYTSICMYVCVGTYNCQMQVYLTNIPRTHACTHSCMHALGGRVRVGTLFQYKFNTCISQVWQTHGILYKRAFRWTSTRSKYHYILLELVFYIAYMYVHIHNIWFNQLASCSLFFIPATIGNADRLHNSSHS